MRRLFIKSSVKDVMAIEIKLNLGSLQEHKPGTANVLIPLWRMSEQAKELERLGVSFSLEKGFDFLSVRVKARYVTIDKVTELLTGMLLNPPVEKFEDAIREAKALIATSREDTATRAIAEVLRLLFRNHPYSIHPTAFDYKLNEITKEDIKRALDNLGVISVTVVAPEDVVTINLPSVDYTELPIREFGNGSIDIKLENKVQATIAIAYPTYEITNLEGSFRMMVVNTILGGMGLISRLYKEVRVKRGLAYYAYSMYWPLGSSGVFLAMAGVRREVLKEAIDIMLNVINNATVTIEDLNMAVRNRVGRLKISKESPEGIASLFSVIPTYGLSNDYYDRYISYISKLRPEDIANEIKNLTRHVIATVG
ncbi:MAG: M16 family metallopeptidase [Vulcanisaeta sp. AZ3]